VIDDAPMAPDAAKVKYLTFLSDYELSEIMLFPEIYYVGYLNRKATARPTAANNNGFDSSTHHYRCLPGDQIAYRYEIQSVFGKGAFGQVLRCFDHKAKCVVAVKIVINTPQMSQQGAAEMEIVAILNSADTTNDSHVISMNNRFVWRNHVCAVFEVLGHNLYEALRANRFQPYGGPSLRAIGRQLLRSLQFTHANGFVHCDLKPENILLLPNSKAKIRLIDFGSACRIGQKHFDYIQSRFYRAPEVILGIPYGPPMDVWSFACIMAELGTGKPLFPGESELQQLRLHVELCGLPPAAILETAARRRMFFEENGRPLIDVKHKRSLAKLTGFADRDLLDLLSKCLVWDQAGRITAEEALAHPFFAAREVTVVKSPRSAARGASPPASARRYTDPHPIKA
jgi:dual specificity tyrosine-phosphorylation-regulated kinase 2/3/4